MSACLAHGRFAATLATLGMSAFLAACGGGDTAPLQSSTSVLGQTQARALTAGSHGNSGGAATTAAGRVLVVKTYNLLTDWRDTDSAGFRNSIALLDAAGISFQIVDCGILANKVGDPIGAPSPASWALFSIAADDLAMAKARGFEVHDPSLEWTFEAQRVCGGWDEALSAGSRIIGYARIVYPDLFPGVAGENEWEGYTYAVFINGNYVGVKGNRVFVHNGKNWNFQDVGAVTDYIKGL